METQFADHGKTAWDLPSLLFPDPSRLFAERSRRFSALAENHSLGEWLLFLGRLTEIQHRAAGSLGGLPLPQPEDLAAAASEGRPPISACAWSRDPGWREILVLLARELAPQAPLPAQETLGRLAIMDAAASEHLADLVLACELPGEEAAALPFIAAALQVYWTRMAAGLGRLGYKPHTPPGAGCPCCGFPPVASIVRVDGEVAKRRFLHCPLCNTEWHLTRVTCAACGAGDRIAYRHIDGTEAAVCVETCDSCKGYLKILYQEKALQADPVADDLATLALDLLADEEGYGRIGPNLLLIPG